MNPTWARPNSGDTIPILARWVRSSQETPNYRNKYCGPRIKAVECAERTLVRETATPAVRLTRPTASRSAARLLHGWIGVACGSALAGRQCHPAEHSFPTKEQPKNSFRKVFITLRVMSAKAAVSSALQGPITRSVMATSGGNREVVFRPIPTSPARPPPACCAPMGAGPSRPRIRENRSSCTRSSWSERGRSRGGTMPPWANRQEPWRRSHRWRRSR